MPKSLTFKIYVLGEEENSLRTKEGEQVHFAGMQIRPQRNVVYFSGLDAATARSASVFNKFPNLRRAQVWTSLHRSTSSGRGEYQSTMNPKRLPLEKEIRLSTMTLIIQPLSSKSRT